MPTKKATSKTVTKKAAKKVAATKVAAKKVATKKPAAAKGTAKKSASSLATTRIFAKVDVSYGNILFIRGEGGGLSWTVGTPMENISSDEWKWESSTAENGVVFKFLINDEIWGNGEDLTVAAGGTSISSPSFY